jgi:hypothetical protein
MTDNNKVTLDIELKDLLDIVSKSSGRSHTISEQASDHMIEGEDLRKAWFKHLLISMEKLNDLVENIRRHDLSELKQEFKSDLKALENKIAGVEKEFKDHKKDVVDPLNNKVIALTVKLGLISLMAGVVGSGITGLLFFALKEFLFKPAGIPVP